MDALERDFYEERRRKWRRSAFWRGFGVAALIALIVAALPARDALESSRSHIARLSVSGVIVDDIDRDLLLADLAEADEAQAVVVRINSPGGTTAGSEALFAGLREIAKRKPVVAVLGEVAASGGYITAIAADHIIARGNTLTGSIGVIMEYPDLTTVMERIGVDLMTVRSSELKAEPSPFRPTNPEALELSAELVADSFEWFRDLVGERRRLAGAELSEVSNGAVFTGRQALDNGLVDGLGGEADALAWLESRESGLGDLPVRDWQAEREEAVWGRLLGKIVPTGGILGEISRWQGPKLYSIGP